MHSYYRGEEVTHTKTSDILQSDVQALAASLCQCNVPAGTAGREHGGGQGRQGSGCL